MKTNPGANSSTGQFCRTRSMRSWGSRKCSGSNGLKITSVIANLSFPLRRSISTKKVLQHCLKSAFRVPLNALRAPSDKTIWPYEDGSRGGNTIRGTPDSIQVKQVSGGTDAVGFELQSKCSGNLPGGMTPCVAIRACKKHEAWVKQIQW